MNRKNQYLRSLGVTLGVAAIAATALAAPKDKAEDKLKDKPAPTFDWTTVVNNNDLMPGAPNERTFNSYNQPSVNSRGLVVLRARSKGGGGDGGGGDEQGGGGGHGPTHGIYTRDMAVGDSEIIRILDRTTRVPEPNNLGTTFVETPSFPRIDMDSDTIATRGNHQPAWLYTPEGEDETRAGTTGIYTNPFGDLITGASKLGAVTEFSFFGVPESPGTLFEVFPGAPSVTAGNTIVFKGNYTEAGIPRTGVYYRVLQDRPIGEDDLSPAGGDAPAVLIANSASTLIPGTSTVFGSTAPPSAADGQVVFAGFDDEDNPSLGGVYLAPLEATPELTPLVSIGGPVPDEPPSSTFNGLGEGGAFDGRFVGVWGSWGDDTRTVRLYCQTEGNRDRIDFCNQALECEDAEPGAPPLGDPDSVCDDESDRYYGERCYQERSVPVNQGFFVYDSKTRKTWTVAKTGEQFDEFLYWNYSGKVPCTGGGHSEEGAEDDGEPARWRSSAFVAVSGRGATFKAAFKARAGDFADGVYVDPVDGIYLMSRPATGQSPIATVLDTTMDGQSLDPEAPEGSIVAEVGIEREGLRGDLMVINAKMAALVEEGEEEEEEEDMAGIYLTNVK
ncbi:MAG: hypothetical protein OEV47_10105 [Gammaproteobacteria bacterium]|nr:hypothetical protein [Gammaproteobacteria bacterium]